MTNFSEIYKTCKDSEYDILDAYKAKKSHLSHSSLSKFRSSPFEFLMYKSIDRPKTKALSDGSMMHMLLLEPEKFSKGYYVVDDDVICKTIAGEHWESKGKRPRSTAKYKEWIAAYENKYQGMERVDIVQLKNLQASIDRALDSNLTFKDLIRKLRQDGKAENAMIKDIKGYPVKAILDIDHPDFIADLKFVSNNSLQSTYRDYWGEKYWTWVQQGLYASLYDFKKKHFLLYMNHQGDVAVRSVPVAALQRGHQEFLYWLEKFDYCINDLGRLNLDSSFWQNQNSHDLILPQWISDSPNE